MSSDGPAGTREPGADGVAPPLGRPAIVAVGLVVLGVYLSGVALFELAYGTISTGFVPLGPAWADGIRIGAVVEARSAWLAGTLFLWWCSLGAAAYTIAALRRDLAPRDARFWIPLSMGAAVLLALWAAGADSSTVRALRPGLLEPVLGAVPDRIWAGPPLIHGAEGLAGLRRLSNTVSTFGAVVLLGGFLPLVLGPRVRGGAVHRFRVTLVLGSSLLAAVIVTDHLFLRVLAEAIGHVPGAEAPVRGLIRAVDLHFAVVDSLTVLALYLASHQHLFGRFLPESGDPADLLSKPWVRGTLLPAAGEIGAVALPLLAGLVSSAFPGAGALPG